MFNDKKKNIGICVIILGLSVIILLFCLISAIHIKPLTQQQKVEDFSYLYNVLIEHQPMLEGYKEVIGFDFEGNKEYYEELIRNTKDDYEFYVMMEMIMGDFPGVHTGLHIVPYDEVQSEGHRTSPEIDEFLKIYDKWEYWNAYRSKYYSEEKGKTTFSYHDGRYISNDISFSENKYQTLELLEIEGEHVDEYVKRKEVNGKLAYDSQYDKVYRYTLSFNLSHGKLVRLKFKNTAGEILERELYIRNKDNAFEEGELLPVEIPEVKKLEYDNTIAASVVIGDGGYHYQIVSDKVNNLSFIYLNDLESADGRKLAEEVEAACENDNIILDLRMNGGGYVEYFLEYVYPYLYVEDLKSSICFYTDETTVNKKLCNNSADKKAWDEEFENNLIVADGKNVIESKRYFYGYGNAKEEKKVYVLISNLSASAADSVAAFLKNGKKAVLIGTPTAGEGIADTYCVDIMPNSHMTFRFQSSQAFNPDGTDNSVYGTIPDIYIAYTFQSLVKRNQLMQEGITAIDYEQRLKWDNVLLETIKMIEKKEE